MNVESLLQHTNLLWPMAAPYVGVFLLTAARLLGLIWTAPVLGSRVVPWPMRLLLAITLALAIAPWPTATWSMSSWTTTTSGAVDWPDVPLLVIGEGLLGASLGLGIRLILHGLGLAAVLIDQQAGLAAGQMLDPLSGEEVTPTTALLTLGGTAVLLSLGPISGDLRLMRVVLDSFAELPPGTVTDLTSPVTLLNHLLLQSFWLGLRVAMPVVVMVGLVHAGVIWITRRSPMPGLPTILTPVRIGLTLVVLALTMTDIGDQLIETLSTGIDDLHVAWHSPPNSGRTQP